MPATVKDAASVRRQLLAAQLLRGEQVMVTQQGAIQLLSDQSISEVAITVPEGKLAAPSLYWYERDPELFQAELEAMNHFFPQFRPDRLIDNRMSWLGSLASGIPGSQRIWHMLLVYDNYHPHGEDYGGSIDLDGFNREDWLIIAKGLGALLLLAGLIWIVVMFYEWIAIGFCMWLFGNLRGIWR